MPVRVDLFDEVELPLPPPAFQSIFLFDGGRYVIAMFSPDEAVESVAYTEIRPLAHAMLMDASGQV